MKPGRGKNGRFQSGNSGRPKGSKNKTNKLLRERIEMLLDSQFDRVVTDMEALTPKERIQSFIQLLEYGIPKLQRTEAVTIEEADELGSKTKKEVESEVDRLILLELQSPDSHFHKAIRVMYGITERKYLTDADLPERENGEL